MSYSLGYIVLQWPCRNAPGRHGPPVFTGKFVLSNVTQLIRNNAETQTQDFRLQIYSVSASWQYPALHLLVIRLIVFDCSSGFPWSMIRQKESDLQHQDSTFRGNFRSFPEVIHAKCRKFRKSRVTTKNHSWFHQSHVTSFQPYLCNLADVFLAYYFFYKKRFFFTYFLFCSTLPLCLCFSPLKTEW